jgi:hypothetical protein
MSKSLTVGIEVRLTDELPIVNGSPCAALQVLEELKRGIHDRSEYFHKGREGMSPLTTSLDTVLREVTNLIDAHIDSIKKNAKVLVAYRTSWEVAAI